MTALLALLAAALAACLALLFSTRGRRRQLESLVATRDAELETERARRVGEAAARAALQAEVAAERKAADEKLALVQDAQRKLADTFGALSQSALQANSDQFLRLARESLGRFAEAANGDLEKRQTAIAELVRPVRDSLEKVDGRIREIESARDRGSATRSQSIRVVPRNRKGDAPGPAPSSSGARSSSTPALFRVIPVLRGKRPERVTECPGAVSVIA